MWKKERTAVLVAATVAIGLQVLVTLFLRDGVAREAPGKSGGGQPALMQHFVAATAPLLSKVSQHPPRPPAERLAAAGLSVTQPKIWSFYHPPAEMPGYMVQLERSCIELNPEFEYVTLTPSTVAQLVDDLHWSFWYLSPRDQHDVVKAFILRDFGDFYFDKDVLCVRPLIDIYHRSLESHSFGIYKLGNAMGHSAWGPTRPGSEVTRRWTEALNAALAKESERTLRCFFEPLARNMSLEEHDTVKTLGDTGCGQWGEFGIRVDREILNEALNKDPRIFGTLLRMGSMDGHTQHESKVLPFVPYSRKPPENDQEADIICRECHFVHFNNAFITPEIKAMNETEFMKSGLRLAQLVRRYTSPAAMERP